MKAMVLFSGGLDSTTCLAMAIETFGKDNVIALSIHYGQKHEKEIEAARRIIEYYEVKSDELDLSKIFAASNCSLLTHSTKHIPHGTYESQHKESLTTPVSTYVPFRNGLFLSVAAAMALSYDCTHIYYGAHQDDAAFSAYPDCSEEFFNAMKQAVYLGSGNAVTLEAPFIHQTKADIVREGLLRHVPYELTWSCYEGNTRPCGVCGTCLDRIRAFEANHSTDPLQYE